MKRRTKRDKVLDAIKSGCFTGPEIALSAFSGRVDESDFMMALFELQADGEIESTEQKLQGWRLVGGIR